MKNRCNPLFTYQCADSKPFMFPEKCKVNIPFDCNVRLVAVFTTSEIQQSVFGNHTVLKSTGKLEDAIQQGYTCYVVSTRTKLSDTDAWWRALVPDERIFLTSKEESDEDRGFANSPSTIRPWENLYQVLGIKPLPLKTPDWEEEEGYDAEPMTCAFRNWQSAQYQLEEKHNVRLGWTFAKEIR